jgi:hypothetical protein
MDDFVDKPQKITSVGNSPVSPQQKQLFKAAFCQLSPSV